MLGTYWQQSWIQHGRLCGKSTCCFGPVHTGNKVDSISNKVDRYKLSNSGCCQFVVKTGNKVHRIGNRVHHIGDSRLCCRFVADRFVVAFGNSQLFRQCEPGFNGTNLWYRMPVQVHVVQQGLKVEAHLQLMRGRIHRGCSQLQLLP